MSLSETTLQPAMIASGEAEAGGVLTIDLAAIAANWKRLYGMTVPVECAAVVKADAYGCGIERVVPALKKIGCRTFFVADIAEGRRVRAAAPEAVIYLLNGLMPGTAAAFADANLRPVINSPTELAEWDTFVASNNWRGGAALHVDTGMNRLGLTPEEAAAIAPRVQTEGHGFKLLMSHFACAETPEHPMNDRQIRLFREIRILFRGVPSSLANSAGIFLGGTAHCDLVRPGIALFGGNPIPGQKNAMRAVAELKGRITQVRDDQERRQRGLRRELDRGAPDAARHRRDRLWRRLLPRGRRHESQSAGERDRRRQALPADRTHLDGPDRGRCDRRAGRRRAARRIRDPDRRRDRRRRARHRLRHHQL